MSRVVRLLGESLVVAILGARQVGKTTLAQLVSDRLRLRRPHLEISRFDLEDPRDLAKIEDPLLALQDRRGLVVLDEVQHRPDLLSVLRVLADRPEPSARFLILGSASPDLTRQSAESLAGRVAFHTLDGLELSEVGPRSLDRLWLRGGFPRSFLAPTERASARWRRDFVRTFLERDLPGLGLRIPPLTLRRFWTMLAHYHGQVWNASELARAFGVAHTTVRRYLDTLSSTFVVFQLSAWHENLGKRQVRSPKVYLADSGLLHSLLGVEQRDALLGHPKVGASWEGFALKAVVARLGARPEETFFWATHAGAELDLLVVRGTRRLGFEFKHTSAPRTTRSMHSALRDLSLDSLDVVHPGPETFPLTNKIRALSLHRLQEDLLPLGAP